jgi:predicted membrane protein (TIGR00267 family)
MQPDKRPEHPEKQADEVVHLLQKNWQAEMDGARVYRELASAEKDERRKAILLRMAEAEERHAGRWEKKLTEWGATTPGLSTGLSQRLNRWWNRLVGTDIAIRRMEAAEDRDIARYSDQQKRVLSADAELPQILRKTAIEERAHARAIQTMVPVTGPQTALDAILKRERWHGRGGSWVADAIYGVNDGLGAVFGMVSGVAGATGNQQHYVLIAGLAGMLASALSMGSGAYLAVKSEREVHEAEIARERQEAEENPEEELEEMALFYQLQGFSEDEAQRMAQRISQDPEQMLRAMAQQELGLSEEHFRSPVVSALSAALSTAVGAFIPIVPFFFMSGVAAVIVAAIVSLAAHFVVGAAKSLITTRPWWASGMEMTMVGAIEAAVTYGLGRAFGAL